MKSTSFATAAKNVKPKKPTTKAKCEHQEMMELVINAGYAPKKYQPRWAKWIKQSGINVLDLQRLITIAESLTGYSPKGFVRNRLIDRDWRKHF